jgi:hypothetical protein
MIADQSKTRHLGSFAGKAKQIYCMNIFQQRWTLCLERLSFTLPELLLLLCNELGLPHVLMAEVTYLTDLLRHRPAGTQGATSSNVIWLGRNAITSGVINLYGCTSIVVLNETCLWMSHFFEHPSFLSGDEVFKRDVLYGLREGDDPRESTNDDPADWHDYGLTQLTQPGGLLSYDQKVFIITPRPRTTPGCPDARPGTLLYANRVAQIRTVLQELMTDVVPNVIDYVPRRPDLLYQASGGQIFENLYGKVIWQYEPMHCFQLDPKGGGGLVPIARLELRVENTLVGDWKWRAHHYQLVLELEDVEHPRDSLSHDGLLDNVRA